MSKRSKAAAAEDLKVSVCGLGFVGSTIAAVWLRAGATVIGFDKDPKIIQIASHGKTHTDEPQVGEAFTNGLKTGRFHATSDPAEAYRYSTVKIVAVHVGLYRGDADLSALTSALQDIGETLNKGDTVIVKPTLPIGRSRSILIPTLEKSSGLKVEKDFFYVYSPERISAGQAVADIEEHYPAIVSGVGSRSLDRGAKLYSFIARKGVVKMSSLEAAEAEKIFEGVYRDVNIALAGEMAKICSTVGISFWEVRDAANSQPYSHIHKAGIGVGGFCIPVYPHFLIRTAKKQWEEASLTTLARKINCSMPRYCVQQALDSAKASGTPVKKAALLGLAFRGDVPDKRLSPTYAVIKELRRHGLQISVHDPYIPEDRDLPRDVYLTRRLEDAVRDADLIILCTDHKMYSKLSGESLVKMTRRRPVVYDGRNILKRELFKELSLTTIGVGTESNQSPR